jgi:hypothetical protein
MTLIPADPFSHPQNAPHSAPPLTPTTCRAAHSGADLRPPTPRASPGRARALPAAPAARRGRFRPTAAFLFRKVDWRLSRWTARQRSGVAPRRAPHAGGRRFDRGGYAVFCHERKTGQTDGLQSNRRPALPGRSCPHGARARRWGWGGRSSSASEAIDACASLDGLRASLTSVAYRRVPLAEGRRCGNMNSKRRTRPALPGCPQRVHSPVELPAGGACREAAFSGPGCVHSK